MTSLGTCVVQSIGNILKKNYRKNIHKKLDKIIVGRGSPMT